MRLIVWYTSQQVRPHWVKRFQPTISKVDTRLERLCVKVHHCHKVHQLNHNLITNHSLDWRATSSNVPSDLSEHERFSIDLAPKRYALETILFPCSRFSACSATSAVLHSAGYPLRFCFTFGNLCATILLSRNHWRKDRWKVTSYSVV